MSSDAVDAVLAAADAAGIVDRRELVALALRHAAGQPVPPPAADADAAPDSREAATLATAPGATGRRAATGHNPGLSADNDSAPLCSHCLSAAANRPPPAASTRAPARRQRAKTPLAALGSAFFDRDRFRGDTRSVDEFVDNRLAAVEDSLTRAPIEAGDGNGAPRMLAIYPGSFNPPTRAHLAIAAAVAEMPDVRALWMDLTTPYKQKQCIAEVACERREMVELVLRDIPTAGCASLMKAMGNSGGTAAYFDTLRRCAGPGGRVAWVVGSDVVAGMRHWAVKARTVLASVDTLIVFLRDADGRSVSAAATTAAPGGSDNAGGEDGDRQDNGSSGSSGGGVADRNRDASDSGSDSGSSEGNPTAAAAIATTAARDAETDNATAAVSPAAVAAEETWQVLELLLRQDRAVLAASRRVVLQHLPRRLQPVSSTRALRLVDRALREVTSDVLGYIAANPALRRHYKFPST